MYQLKFHLAIIAITAAASAPAGAQVGSQTAQVTVQASHNVHRRQIGMSETGIPLEEISLSRHVSYADLDLTSAQGLDELDKRIETTAKEACQQLKTLYPLEQWETDNAACVADAVHGAKEQLHAALVAAKERSGNP